MLTVKEEVGKRCTVFLLEEVHVFPESSRIPVRHKLFLKKKDDEEHGIFLGLKSFPCKTSSQPQNVCMTLKAETKIKITCVKVLPLVPESHLQNVKTNYSVLSVSCESSI